MSHRWKVALLVGGATGIVYAAGALVAWSCSPQALGAYLVGMSVGTVAAAVTVLTGDRRKGRGQS